MENHVISWFTYENLVLRKCRNLQKLYVVNKSFIYLGSPLVSAIQQLEIIIVAIPKKNTLALFRQPRHANW